MNSESNNNLFNPSLTPNSKSLIPFILSLGDHSLIAGHRNSEWCGHGPILEQDIAITNISLDLIGQARNFYQYAATLIGNGATEDTLAYLRSANEFKNCILFELPKGDWAFTIVRQFFFSNFQWLYFQELQNSRDEQLAAIAAKSLKEVTYHLRWSSEWVIRLGDGTEESHNRLENALEELWSFTGELFTPAEYEQEAFKAGFGVNVSALKAAWEQKVNEIFAEATLPDAATGGREGVWMQAGGKEGIHTEQLGFILAELQYMQRAYPGAEW